MKILGIDPGYDRLGIAIIENGSLIHSACFTTSNKDDFHERLAGIGERVKEIIKEFKPDSVAIETLFISKNQRTAMRVSEARGVILYESKLSNTKIYEYSPLQIKMAVTGYGKSDKTQIIKMIPLLIKIKNKDALDDEYDAIAVALTCQAMTAGVKNRNH